LQGENFERAQKALAMLLPIAKQHQTSLGNLALAWIIAQPQTCAITGVRNAEQVCENRKAVDVTLAQEEIEQISSIGRIVTESLDKSSPVMWDF
jgi:aryl-alcohol dehydrogenase-like predicted oxidoreductase